MKRGKLASNNVVEQQTNLNSCATVIAVVVKADR